MTPMIPPVDPALLTFGEMRRIYHQAMQAWRDNCDGSPHDIARSRIYAISQERKIAALSSALTTAQEERDTARQVTQLLRVTLSDALEATDEYSTQLALAHQHLGAALYCASTENAVMVKCEKDFEAARAYYEKNKP